MEPSGGRYPLSSTNQLERILVYSVGAIVRMAEMPLSQIRRESLLPSSVLCLPYRQPDFIKKGKKNLSGKGRDRASLLEAISGEEDLWGS